VLRLWHLGARSLWFDEGASVQFATMPWREWLPFLWHGEANMLPYYLLLRPWLLLGHSELMVRLPSALFGAATVPVIYALARRFSGALAGVIAAAVLAVHGFHVSYSQQARSYSMAVFFLSVAWLALTHLVERNSARARWIYLVAAGFAAYCHFFAGLVLISQWISVACFAPAGTLKRLLRLGFTTAAIILPAVLYGFAHRGGLNWIPPTTVARLVRSALIFSGNRVALVAAFALLVAWAMWRAVKVIVHSGRSLSTWSRGAALVWLLFTPTLLLGVSAIKPMLVSRYLVLVIPALAMVAAAALAEMKPVVASSLAVLLSLALLQTTLSGKNFDQPRQDWRGAADYLTAHAAPGDAAVFLPDIGRAPFNWYWHERPDAEIVYPGRGVGFSWRTFHQRPEVPLDAVKAAPPSRTWLLMTTPELDPKAPLFRDGLASIYPYSCERQLEEVLIVLYAKDPVGCAVK
jgi:mannosyltransferase